MKDGEFYRIIKWIYPILVLVIFPYAPVRKLISLFGSQGRILLNAPVKNVDYSMSHAQFFDVIPADDSKHNQ